jgi:hypothetical protein
MLCAWCPACSNDRPLFLLQWQVGRTVISRLTCAAFADKLKAADLKATSKAMQAHNEKTLARLQQQWQGHFDRIFDGLPPAAQQPRVQEMDFEKALLAQYGVSLSGCYEQTVTH